MTEGLLVLLALALAAPGYVLAYPTDARTAKELVDSADTRAYAHKRAR